jgi:lipopolysaccharide biosynthesis glycosyltransferase
MNIYIGYDSSNYGQEIAYRVCRRSIENHNADIHISPIKLKDLRKAKIFDRPREKNQSTEFTYTRFLTPHLNKYSGKALFCDSDFLWRCDAAEVLDFIDDDHSVSCVRHEYTSCPTETKMDGLKQEWYPKKNWSSLMLFNAGHEDCKKLTKEVVNSESPKYLHRMEWTTDEKIGSIPIEYNYLIGYYSSENPRVLHFTDGGPWHQNTKDVEYSGEWLSYLTDEERRERERGEFWKYD